MKTILFLLAFLTLSAQAQHHHHKPSVGVHGMLVVGSGQTYLSHLPMFHDPHAAQVIVEAELDAKAKALYLESLKSHKEKVYTLVPETFDLFAMPGEFKGQLFRGHFERGGKLLSNVKVKITKKILFRSFKGLPAKSNDISFVVFGNETEQFAAHLITSKPDFDQVFRIQSEVHQGKIELRGVSNDQPLNFRGETFAVHEQRVQVKVTFLEDLYTETGDLSH